MRTRGEGEAASDLMRNIKELVSVAHLNEYSQMNLEHAVPTLRLPREETTKIYKNSLRARRTLS